MSLSFHHFLHVFGEAGARERFENFVVATVKSVRPEARPVRANPGDWGIDVYVGSLAQGQVAVWQAKFFLEQFGDTQKAQVRAASRRPVRTAIATTWCPRRRARGARAARNRWARDHRRARRPGPRVDDDRTGALDKRLGRRAGDAAVRTVRDPGVT